MPNQRENEKCLKTILDRLETAKNGESSKFDTKFRIFDPPSLVKTSETVERDVSRKNSSIDMTRCGRPMSGLADVSRCDTSLGL